MSDLVYASKLQRWGNSQGIRIPKRLLEDTGITLKDRIELKSTDQGILIRKASPLSKQTLEEYLEEFYGKPLDQIPPLPPQKEIDWGDPVGDEVW